jgi:hypothetical protein
LVAFNIACKHLTRVEVEVTLLFYCKLVRLSQPTLFALG